MDEKIKKLIAIGGSEWVSGEHHRIYFNDLIQFIGLEITRYGTRNISCAKLDGESISNSEAKRILASLPIKFWYDVPSGRFQATGGDLIKINKIAAAISKEFTS